jgi:hypothetical protein
METVSNGTCPRTPSGLVVPRIHDNGTSKQKLLDAMDIAWLRVGSAATLLKETVPNARDYDKDTYERAWMEYAYRLKRICDVQDELAELATAISEQE